MPKIEVYKCGECGKLKGESNHWWWVGQWQSSPSVPSDQPVFWAAVMDSGTPIAASYDCYCGQECVSKALARYMASVGQPKEAA